MSSWCPSGFHDWLCPPRGGINPIRLSSLPPHAPAPRQQRLVAPGTRCHSRGRSGARTRCGPSRPTQGASTRSTPTTLRCERPIPVRAASTAAAAPDAPNVALAWARAGARSPSRLRRRALRWPARSHSCWPLRAVSGMVWPFWRSSGCRSGGLSTPLDSREVRSVVVEPPRRQSGACVRAAVARASLRGRRAFAKALQFADVGTARSASQLAGARGDAPAPACEYCCD